MFGLYASMPDLIICLSLLQFSIILSGCSILYHFYGADIQSLLGITSHWYWSQDVSRLLDAPPHLRSWGHCKMSDSIQVRLAISKCIPRWLIWWLWYVCCVPLYWWRCIKCGYSAAEIFLFIILTSHRSEKALELNIPYFYKCSIKPSLFGSLFNFFYRKKPSFLYHWFNLKPQRWRNQL